VSEWVRYPSANECICRNFFEREDLCFAKACIGLLARAHHSYIADGPRNVRATASAASVFKGTESSARRFSSGCAKRRRTWEVPRHWAKRGIEARASPMRCLDEGREGLKHEKRCAYRLELDARTLVATRGRDFPLVKLSERL